MGHGYSGTGGTGGSGGTRVRLKFGADDDVTITGGIRVKNGPKKSN